MQGIIVVAFFVDVGMACDRSSLGLCVILAVSITRHPIFCDLSCIHVIGLRYDSSQLVPSKCEYLAWLRIWSGRVGNVLIE